MLLLVVVKYLLLCDDSSLCRVLPDFVLVCPKNVDPCRVYDYTGVDVVVLFSPIDVVVVVVVFRTVKPCAMYDVWHK